MEQLPPNRIKQLRDARGWSLRDLAERTSITHTKLQRIESGTTPPDFNDMRHIARGLGVRISALLNDEDVELRMDEAGGEILNTLAAIPEEFRMDVLVASQHVVRVATGMAAVRSAAALKGEPDLVDKLASRWNSLQDSERPYALDLWNIAKLGKTA